MGQVAPLPLRPFSLQAPRERVAFPLSNDARWGMGCPRVQRCIVSGERVGSIHSAASVSAPIAADMALKRCVVTALLLSGSMMTFAHPRALNPPSLSILVPTLFNTTTAPPRPRPPIGAIVCFTPEASHRTTTVAGCRPTLNHFRSFPNYRLVQDFQQGGLYPRPKLPSKPPYAVHNVNSDCAVQIASEREGVRDDFSFEQARGLAIEILEECEGKGGRGGVAPIGHGVGWAVSVIGWKVPEGGEVKGGAGRV